MTRERALEILYHLSQAVLETCKDAGSEGAPEGPMYAAFMSYGIGLDTFTKIVNALIAAGKLRRSGHVLYAI